MTLIIYCVEAFNKLTAEYFSFFITEGWTSCTIEDVLIFFTGTDRIPPSGFDKEPTIHFIHDKSAKFCTANTCDL